MQYDVEYDGGLIKIIINVKMFHFFKERNLANLGRNLLDEWENCIANLTYINSLIIFIIDFTGITLIFLRRIY